MITKQPSISIIYWVLLHTSTCRPAKRTCEGMAPKGSLGCWGRCGCWPGYHWGCIIGAGCYNVTHAVKTAPTLHQLHSSNTHHAIWLLRRDTISHHRRSSHHGRSSRRLWRILVGREMSPVHPLVPISGCPTPRCSLCWIWESPCLNSLPLKVCSTCPDRLFVRRPHVFSSVRTSYSSQWLTDSITHC